MVGMPLDKSASPSHKMLLCLTLVADEYTFQDPSILADLSITVYHCPLILGTFTSRAVL